MTHQQRLGAQGEALAAQFLEAKGYTIVDTNWHCRYGEIDIVACQNEVWVFVEVKTRRGRKPESAFSSITPQKQEKFIKSVQLYRSEHDLDDVMWRIDAIGVAIPHNSKPVIEHVEDAFDW